MSGTPLATHKFPVTENRSPELEIEITGVLGNAKKIKAIVDTGFEGFLQLPLVDGIATNLSLWAIQPFTLADGSKNQCLVCFGEVKALGKAIVGEIVLSPSGGPLIGIQLLKRLGMNTTYSHDGKEIIFTEIAVPTPTPAEPMASSANTTSESINSSPSI